MKTQSQQILWIPIEKLVAHPKNANVMSKQTMKKLRLHIENTGRYEPLIVRKHPQQKNSYELINGHHRKQILQDLGETSAACVVWELTDAETLMLLATVNRLGGEDAAGKRVDLIETLSAEMEMAAEELAKWLPEDNAVLTSILQRDQQAIASHAPDLDQMDEPFTVFLKHEEKRRLVTALKKENPDLARSLMIWLEKNQ